MHVSDTCDPGSIPGDGLVLAFLMDNQKYLQIAYSRHRMRIISILQLYMDIDVARIIKDTPISKLAVSIYNAKNLDSLDLCSLTCCESSNRELMVCMIKNASNIDILYDPISMYRRKCLFVTPDHLNVQRLDAIFDANPIYVYYDVESADSPITRFKDTPIKETIYKNSGLGNVTDVVIVFRPHSIRQHVRQVCGSRSRVGNSSGAEYHETRETFNERQKVIDKYISGLSGKGVWFLIVIVILLVTFSLIFGVDDEIQQKPEMPGIENTPNILSAEEVSVYEPE